MAQNITADDLVSIAEDYGRMYANAQNTPENSTAAQHLVRTSAPTGWNCDQPQAQPNSGTNSSSTLASADGTHGTRDEHVQSSDPDILIVAIEGFQLNNDFYAKELAFFNPTNMRCWSGLFKAPFEKKYLKKKAADVIENFTRTVHGLKWEEGVFPYPMIYHVVSHFGSENHLYSKGKDMCAWLQQFTSTPVIDLDQFGCPGIQELPHGCLCMHHNTLDKSCAIDKAVRLGQYYTKMFSLQPVAMPVVNNQE